jgi:hypothetical protein
MTINDLGVKDRTAVEALFHENPNYKAIVTLIDSKTGEDKKSVNITCSTLIPFNSVVQAQSYIDNELPKLGLRGLLLKVNEEEIKDYYVMFNIRGIYGSVSFCKTFSKRTKDEMLNMKMNLCEPSINDFITEFDVEVYSTYDEFVFGETVKGYPKGITEEQYYKYLEHINKKYFKDKKDYLDDYKKNETDYLSWSKSQAEEDRKDKIQKNSDTVNRVLDLYSNAQSRIKDIASSYTDDSVEQLSAYKNGQILLADSVSPEEIANLKKSGDCQVYGNLGTYYYDFNINKAPFDNLKVRQAFNLAIVTALSSSGCRKTSIVFF